MVSPRPAAGEPERTALAEPLADRGFWSREPLSAEGRASGLARDPRSDSRLTVKRMRGPTPAERLLPPSLPPFLTNRGQPHRRRLTQSLRIRRGPRRRLFSAGVVPRSSWTRALNSRESEPAADRRRAAPSLFRPATGDAPKRTGPEGPRHR